MAETTFSCVFYHLTKSRNVLSVHGPVALACVVRARWRCNSQRRSLCVGVGALTHACNVCLYSIESRKGSLPRGASGAPSLSLSHSLPLTPCAQALRTLTYLPQCTRTMFVMYILCLCDMMLCMHQQKRARCETPDKEIKFSATAVANSGTKFTSVHWDIKLLSRVKRRTFFIISVRYKI